MVSNGYEGPVEGGGGGGAGAGCAANTRDKLWDCFCLGETGTASRF